MEGPRRVADVEYERGALTEGHPLDGVAVGVAVDDEIEGVRLGNGLFAEEGSDAEMVGGEAVDRDLIRR